MFFRAYILGELPRVLRGMEETIAERWLVEKGGIISKMQ